MKYNPKIHHRRSIRLKGYDYSKAGAYFITICCHDMRNRFGEITFDEEKCRSIMELSELGKIAYEEWAKIPDRFPNIELDTFQIMPNHMHAIFLISPPSVPSTLAVDPPEKNKNIASEKNLEIWAGASPAQTGEWQVKSCTSPTVGEIVGAYKSLVATSCLKIFIETNKMMGKLWHRNYYEIIIRDVYAYGKISDYIINNPAKWTEDKFFRQKYRNP
jgi:putative transposase